MGLLDLVWAAAYDDFADPRKIKEVYMEDLRSHLKESLNARHVVLLDYEVGNASERASPKLASLLTSSS